MQQYNDIHLLMQSNSLPITTVHAYKVRGSECARLHYKVFHLMSEQLSMLHHNVNSWEPTLDTACTRNGCVIGNAVKPVSVPQPSLGGLSWQPSHWDLCTGHNQQCKGGKTFLNMSQQCNTKIGHILPLMLSHFPSQRKELLQPKQEMK